MGSDLIWTHLQSDREGWCKPFDILINKKILTMLKHLFGLFPSAHASRRHKNTAVAKPKLFHGRYNLSVGSFFKELKIVEHLDCWNARYDKLFTEVFDKTSEAGIHWTKSTTSGEVWRQLTKVTRLKLKTTKVVPTKTDSWMIWTNGDAYSHYSWKRKNLLLLYFHQAEPLCTCQEGYVLIKCFNVGMSQVE